MKKLGTNKDAERVLRVTLVPPACCLRSASEVIQTLTRPDLPSVFSPVLNYITSFLLPLFFTFSYQNPTHPTAHPYLILFTQLRRGRSRSLLHIFSTL